VGANSTARRAVKLVATRALGPTGYSWLQALAMAWDIRTGDWEEPEIGLIADVVRPGETAVDIGANYGSWSFHLDRAVGPTGRVYAFEPVPFTHAALRRVARLLRFRKVEIHAEGCGDQPGSLTFTVPVQDNGAISAGQAHLAGRDDQRDGRERHVRWDQEREVTCPVVRLDDVGLVGDVSFVKCDIEGGELLAFRGARSLLVAHHPTVVAEINPWFLEGFGQAVDDLVGFFIELGYALYRLDAPTGHLLPVAAADVVEANYVFVHPDRLDRLTRRLVGSSES
jgi:FkbM family methyltransferase